MLLHLIACASHWEPTDSAPPAPDLTERLSPGQVRAGVVTDTAALFGGISSEGKAGDVKIYNDRVQFVIQAPGESSYYMEYGGSLIDADIVRPDGEPGRDILDESSPMIGLGRIVKADTVTVISDGADGTAIVRVEGHAAPMQLVTGALESDSIVPDLDLRVRTDFTLEPDGWALKATTSVWNDEDEAQDLAIGEVALVALDVADPWRPGVGRDDPTEDPVRWAGAMGFENEVAFAIEGNGEDLETGAIGRILGSLAAAVTGFGPTHTIEPGESAAWTRWIGVAPDLATLSGEQLQREGAENQELTGSVLASGEPVAGARVHVLDAAGDPLTVAVTGDDGVWNARLPSGTLKYVASGRGNSLQVDLPAGRGWISPYDADPTLALASIADGAPGPAFAEGYGVSDPQASTYLTLTPPGLLHVTIADGGPGIVRAYFHDGDTVVADERLVPGRPSGAAAIAFVRDGAMDVKLEPGTYDLVVYRGVRDELVTGTVTVESGATTDFTADIQAAYTVDGTVTIDPHSHASPSGDGGIPMADRLLVAAANGIDVHVGTDHDHTVDYRPLIAPMGLDARLKSVVADEVSPVLRGHFNAYPATVRAELPNNGAPRWWIDLRSTSELFDWTRQMFGSAGGIIQANHPVGSSGMFTLSGYDAHGAVSDGNRWSNDFDAMELLNSSDHVDNLPYYFDLINRGKLVTPTGVSDSHSHTGGEVGLNLTFLHTGGTLADFNDESLVAAMGARATVVSFGPFIDARVSGEWAPGAIVAPGSTLEVAVKAPSWMPVETVSLYQDGVLVATEACTGTAPTPCTASWPLDPSADASFVVIAESTTSPMIGAHAGNLAWAATSATLVDVGGDGWTAPLPAIEVED